ncbi:MAG: hypothetical protein Q8N95_11140 [Desulfobacterales bacterium]|nr:hypothetical protein [Desulfobacterales bacterium]
MGKEKIHISNLVNMYDPQCVLDEVKTTVHMAYPDFNFDPVEHAFKDILNLFHGKYPGYRQCNTKYHDLRHTSDAFLAMVRLIHGAVLEGEKIGMKNARLALIATLLHDTGYIQTENDHSGTGAKYTLIHVERSIEFMKKYFTGNGFSKAQFKTCADLLLCTEVDIDSSVDKINFSSRETELLGKMLGASDLLGQMADRTYVEKLPFLFHEYREGKVGGFKSEIDLLMKTGNFYEKIKIRLSKDLGNVARFLPAHFKARYGISRNLYEEAIEKNMKYIKQVIKESEIDYNKVFRRTRVVFN